MFHRLDSDYEDNYDMDYDDWCEKADNAFLRSQEHAIDPEPFYDPGLVHDKNTSRPMGFKGKGKNMAKQSTVAKTPQEKCDYYSKRVNNPKLSDGQRRWA